MPLPVVCALQPACTHLHSLALTCTHLRLLALTTCARRSRNMLIAYRPCATNARSPILSRHRPRKPLVAGQPYTSPASCRVLPACSQYTHPSLFTTYLRAGRRLNYTPPRLLGGSPTYQRSLRSRAARLFHSYLRLFTALYSALQRFPALPARLLPAYRPLLLR
ncbi:LAQU0S09e03070g1_1 [Lachancea quebecensis]|uniref:LAQU0S09e03070g1_1 n=1 Tax=Lachancea quebecensis TaxID=1654605 RepID=A0A0N7MLV7_9SACH|nr:LAQU0S09e03070g1_1 [Lachancea quebecensis]